MEYQYLIEKTQKLEALFPNVLDLFEQEIQQLKQQHCLDSASALSAAFEKISTDGRLLNIGIVGRVKAGKSSLLNALFFDGENVLPKAATPMTAALTTLSYGENFRAQVEFFTVEDLKQIEHNANKYTFELKKITDRKYAEFASRPLTSATSDESRVTAHITRQALQEIQSSHPELCASHDQYTRMQKSGLTLADLEYVGVIEPENREALSTELLNYVGAEGKYMPFTKVVHISMPLASLKDISVIDTPGMNDPVQSREARTVDLLKTCDVVFIISPAGQFLNENDLEVMGRITAKEGVQELVLVASQIDTQLYGSEKRPHLNQTLENIKNSLINRATSTLKNLKQHHPEVGAVFDSIIRAPQEHLLHCSGVAYGLSHRLVTPETWDANETKTWDNLTNDYADFFTLQNQQLTQHSLALLANIDNIHRKIESVRRKKDDIIREKMQVLVAGKNQVVAEFTEALLRQIEQRMTLINSSDLDALAKQSAALKGKSNILDKRLNRTYRDCVEHYYREVIAELNREADKQFQVTRSAIGDQSTSETTQYTREKSGAYNWVARKLWGGGSETVSKTETIIHTGPTSVALKGFVHEVGEKLKEASVKQHSGLEIAISKNVTPLINEILEGECEAVMIADVILSVAAKLPRQTFLLNISVPPELAPKGRLKGNAADEYIDRADNFVANVRRTVYDDIDHYFSRIKSTLPDTISSVFVAELDGKIQQIANQVENSTLTLDRLQRFAAQIQGVRK